MARLTLAEAREKYPVGSTILCGRGNPHYEPVAFLPLGTRVRYSWAKKAVFETYDHESGPRLRDVDGPGSNYGGDMSGHSLTVLSYPDFVPGDPSCPRVSVNECTGTPPSTLTGVAAMKMSVVFATAVATGVDTGTKTEIVVVQPEFVPEFNSRDVKERNKRVRQAQAAIAQRADKETIDIDSVVIQYSELSPQSMSC